MRLSGKRARFRDDDYLAITISNPHSLYFIRGEALGAWEAIDGRESKVRYEEVAPNSYQVTVSIGTHPVELAERLQPPRYEYRPGKVELGRCASCGVPARLVSCRWDVLTGIITDPFMGRRMAIFGPAGLETVFQDLESELGEAIPEAVIEAQRRFTLRNLRREELEGGADVIRDMLAVRGLGYLERLNLGEEGLNLILHNARVSLLMVGIFQGAYEVMTGREGSRVTWDTPDAGVLEVRVTPA